MTRRPNPSLSDIARGPKTDGGPSDDWLVARAVEDVQREVAALKQLGDERYDVLHRLYRRLSPNWPDALESPHDRATGELRMPDLGLIVEQRNEARRDLAKAREHASQYHAEVARANLFQRERDVLQQQLAEAQEKLESDEGSWRESLAALKQVANERDTLQKRLDHVLAHETTELEYTKQQLAESRAALARIAEYQADPGRSFHQDYVNVKGIAKDALATATTEESTDA